VTFYRQFNQKRDLLTLFYWLNNKTKTDGSVKPCFRPNSSGNPEGQSHGERDDRSGDTAKNITPQIVAIDAIKNAGDFDHNP
jgi:hypothetical protein